MVVNSHQKPILITGATTGIGRVTVESLVSKGHFVYATVRKDSDFEELNKIENVEAIRVDVTKPEQIEEMKNFILKQDKGLWGIVNNSGVSDFVAINEMDEEDFDYVMQVNLYGPYRVTRALHELIIESRGRIVNIGSVAGIVTTKLYGAYCISKHAIEAYTDVLGLEMDKFGVKVSVIEPGNYKSSIAMSSGIRYTPKLPKRKNTKYREEIREVLSDPNAKADRSQYKHPEPVADAIYHALFSENPLPRYVVVPSDEEGRETIEKAVKELVEYNQWHDYSYNRETLISMLDKYLEPSNG